MAVTIIRSYDQTAPVQDVSDIISILSPSDVPAVTMMGTAPIDNTVYSWQEDALDAPAVNAALQGAAAPAANQSGTTLRTGYTQIFTKTVEVSGTADAVKVHGTQEYPRQMAKKSKEIKRDLEYALVTSAQAAVAGAAGTAMKFAGMQTQFVAGSTLANSGTPRALTETLFLAASQLAYTNGSEPTVAMVKPADSLIIAGFAAATGRQREYSPDDRKITNVVNVYEGPFGTQKIVKNRWLKTSDCLFLDPSQWKLLVLRNWKTIPLGIVGDKRSSEIVGEFGLKHMNYLDGVLLTDLS